MPDEARNLDLPSNWKTRLIDCDFELARKELTYFFQFANQEAATRGEAVVYQESFVSGWQHFAANPCLETAIEWLERGPEYSSIPFGYMMQCCPGGRSAMFESLLGSRYASREFREFEATERRQIEWMLKIKDPITRETTYGPLQLLELAIVESAHAAYLNLGRVFDFEGTKRTAARQFMLFNELLYFFSHVTLRAAVENQFTENQVRKLQGFIGPHLASSAVDSFCRHWPEDRKLKGRSEFFENLNNAEAEYAECRIFQSQFAPLSPDTLVGRLAQNAAEVWERDDTSTKTAIVTAVTDALANMNLELLIKDVGRRIDTVADEFGA